MKIKLKYLAFLFLLLAFWFLFSGYAYFILVAGSNTPSSLLDIIFNYKIMLGALLFAVITYLILSYLLKFILHLLKKL